MWIRRWAIVLTALAPAFSACAGEETHALVADQPAVPAGEIELDRAAVAARMDAWRAARPPAYAYDVETTCDCSRAGSFHVTVVGEERVRVEPDAPGAEAFRVYSPPTPDEAFAMLDEPLALAEDGEISEGRASAAFDPVFGHPVSWTVHGSDGLPSSHAEIRDFVAIDPASLELPPPGLVLVISNQSFADPEVELTVTVDGQVVVDRTFSVDNQHTFVAYRVPLEPGDHTLTVAADTGATHERIVTLGPDRRYLFVGYWGGAAPEPFSLTESDQPLGFG